MSLGVRLYLDLAAALLDLVDQNALVGFETADLLLEGLELGHVELLGLGQLALGVLDVLADVECALDGLVLLGPVHLVQVAADDFLVSLR